jgi:hypothetical protein
MNKSKPLDLSFLIFLTTTALLITSCQSFSVPTVHVVMFDRNGQAVDPRGNAGEDQHSSLLSYRQYETNPLCNKNTVDDCLRTRIHVRSFSAGIDVANKNPQNHSEMAERFRFWKAKCWEVDTPSGECIKPEEQ